jgi:hypothetical protein
LDATKSIIDVHGPAKINMGGNNAQIIRIDLMLSVLLNF